VENASKPRRLWLWTLVAVVVVPALCCLGGCGALFSKKAKLEAEQRELGAQAAAALEQERLDAGVYPRVLAKAAAAHLVYSRNDDGGYTLYFAEPPLFGLPTDFFYVWDREAKDWKLMEFSELFPGGGP
jgi:hypothetical protein